MTARCEGIDVVLGGLETKSCHRLNKRLEYGRAADDTTSGFVHLRMRTSLHDALERNVRPT